MHAIVRATQDAPRGGYNVQKELDKLVDAKKLTKGESTKVRDAFDSSDPAIVPQVAPGSWRMAQAVAWVAKDSAHKDKDRFNDLEWLAGEIVESAPKNALPAHVA